MDDEIFVPTEDSIHIREVWADNIDGEFALIRGIINDHPHISLHTAYPGVVLNPRMPDLYTTIRDNVFHLNLIQLGLTFFNNKGFPPTCGTDKYCIWQFNFSEFSLARDDYDSSSIELLTECGIDVEKNHECGVSASRFAQLLTSSGILMNDALSWVSFGGSYDFSYLLKVLTGRALPDTETEFIELMKTHFPVIYDVKHLMRFCLLDGGLDQLAEKLDVQRVGNAHQAGSDSLLTCCVYLKLKKEYPEAVLDVHDGVLHGLDSRYDM